MRLDEVEKSYRIGYRHSPKQFQRNSFRIETEGRRLVLVGIVKRRVGKGFRIVGVLKPRG